MSEKHEVRLFEGKMLTQVEEFATILSENVRQNATPVRAGIKRDQTLRKMLKRPFVGPAGRPGGPLSRNY